MKKFTIISCSLALAASAMAQQDDNQQKDKKKVPEKPHAVRQGQPPARPEMHKQPVQTTTNGPAQNTPKPAFTPKVHNETTVRGKGAINTITPSGPAETEQLKKEKEHNVPKGPNTVNKITKPTPAVVTAPSPAQVTPQANRAFPNANKLNAQVKKPDIQSIKAEHVNFHAQPKPQQVAAVTFDKSYHIHGSEQWQGEKYNAFRSYQPQWHDQGWYHERYNRVELIGGGYYYWNNGYWYPAWGYSPSESYYAYDGPIYVGTHARPPDQVIADVQSALQQQGYYQGEVDGLLGPLTRQALAGYQADNGLYTTEAIDEPTLSSLGMG